jgi:hypothetical protein
MAAIQGDKPLDGKKLFEVEIQKSIYVLAADEDDAVEIAKSETHRMDWYDVDFDAQESSYVVGEWSKAEPYGSKLGLTCEQIMSQLQEYEKNRPPTKAELEAMGQVPLIPEGQSR